MNDALRKLINDRIEKLNCAVSTLRVEVDELLKERNELLEIYNTEVSNPVTPRKTITPHELKQMSKLTAIKAVRDPNNKLDLYSTKTMIEKMKWYHTYTAVEDK